MKSGKPTSRDVAERAGVSQATVSRALRNSPLVTAETRKRIQNIARELNYSVDRSAAGLRTQQSRTLALLLFEDATGDDAQINPFFLAMVGNIVRAAAAQNYDVLVSFQQLSTHWHTQYELSNRADGLILLGYGDYVTYRAKLQMLANEGAHFIAWGPRFDEHPGHSLSCDNRYGGHLATAHLLAQGRRNIAFLGTTSEHSPEMRDRFLGYADALATAGIDADPALQHDADNHERSGHEAATHLLGSGRRFDGIFAASDLIGIGAIRALSDAGINVPGAVGVVGFDDLPAASYMRPGLTTVRQDTRQAGQLLVHNLLDLIDGRAIRCDTIRPSLVIRRSCGAGR